MKIGDSCFECINRLARRTLELIGAGDESMEEIEKFVKNTWKNDSTPPSIANGVLKMIKDRFQIEDPYESIKHGELIFAMKLGAKLLERFGNNLYEVLKFSALGNSSDFFVERGFDYEEMKFFAHIGEIEKDLSRFRKVLVLGDNVADFVFDLKLIRYLEGIGKEVYYAVKESPVQNDLSMRDVEKYGLKRFFGNFVSTGSGEVGIKKEDIKGLLKELWEGETFVISKGMGNYETLTEFAERPVLYVMKVKCTEVSKSTGYPVGTYIAMYR